MAKFLSLTTLLLLAMFHFSSIFCQFYLDPVNYLIPKESGSWRFHPQRKALDLKELSTSEFLKEIDTRVKNHSAMKVQEPKVSQRRQAPVNTHPKIKRIARKHIDEAFLPDKRETVEQKSWKEESEEDEDNDSASSMIFGIKKKHLKEGLEFAQTSGEQNTCNKKCFMPKCEVKCEGDQSSAACQGTECKSFTRGVVSASICSGKSCEAVCYQKDCMSGCDGDVCFAKCQGKSCNAIAQGNASRSMCTNDGCQAVGYGNKTNIKCVGSYCNAQCMGEKCIASCVGTSCAAACYGKDCEATCNGKKCQQILPVGKLAVEFVNEGHSEEDDIDKETSKATTVDVMKDLYADGKARLGYEIDIPLTPSTVMYIRDKIYQLIKVARFMRYSLPMRK